MKKTLILTLISSFLFITYSCKDNSVERIENSQQVISDDALIKKIRKSEHFTTIFNFTQSEKPNFEDLKNKKNISIFRKGIDSKKIKDLVMSATNYNELIKVYSEIYLDPKKQLERIESINISMQNLVRELPEFKSLLPEKKQVLLNIAFKQEINLKKSLRLLNMGRDCAGGCSSATLIELDHADEVFGYTLIGCTAAMAGGIGAYALCLGVAGAIYDSDTNAALDTLDACFNACLD